MTTLRDEIRRLAEKCMWDWAANNHNAPMSIFAERAILEGVKLVLEREPSEQMRSAGFNASDWSKTIGPIYRAMTRELLKELDSG